MGRELQQFKTVSSNKNYTKHQAIIINKIYNYYPKNIPYNSIAYKESDEYKRIKQKKLIALNNFEFKEYLYDNIKFIFSGYYVDDWCDIIENNCYEFKILLHKNQKILDNDVTLMNELKNGRLDLFVFISVLEKYYYYFVNLTEYYQETDTWSFKNLNYYPKEIEIKIKSLDEFLTNNSYEKLPQYIAKSKVLNIETELQENGNANVFGCLFTELEHI